MKKIICFLSVLLTLTLLAACTNTMPDKYSDNDSAQSNQQSLETTLPKEKQEESSETTSAITQSENNQINSSESVNETSVDLSNDFNGINGCAVWYSTANNQYFYYNEDLCKKEVSPFSTFKIISALIGLQENIIEDKSSTMNYNGTQYPNPEWNNNLTLEQAFQSSCIWYFRQILDEAGEQKVQDILTDLQYGNCDISEWEGSGTNTFAELNGFWLDSSLKISPLEQVEVMMGIFEGESIFDHSNIEIVKNIMLIDDNGTKKIYGKTGSGNNQAWFVGFTEESNTKEYFAIYLDDNSQESIITGNTAKEVALNIFE